MGRGKSPIVDNKGKSSASGAVKFKLTKLNEDTYQVPFPEAPSSAYSAVFKAPSDENLPSSIKTIPLSSMYAMQESLDVDNMDAIMKLSVSQIQNISESQLPTVYKVGDIYLIGDGNHRLSALMAKGVKDARVKVYEVS